MFLADETDGESYVTAQRQVKMVREIFEKMNEETKQTKKKSTKQKRTVTSEGESSSERQALSKVKRRRRERSEDKGDSLSHRENLAPGETIKSKAPIKRKATSHSVVERPAKQVVLPKQQKEEEQPQRSKESRTTTKPKPTVTAYTIFKESVVRPALSDAERPPAPATPDPYVNDDSLNPEHWSIDKQNFYCPLSPGMLFFLFI